MNTENTTAEWVEENKQQFFRETAQAQHSPLPWNYATNLTASENSKGFCIFEDKPGGKTIDREVFIEANAAFIVRACNNAERLADALRNLASFSFTEKEYQESFVKLKREARQALAQWEGGKQ